MLAISREKHVYYDFWSALLFSRMVLNKKKKTNEQKVQHNFEWGRALKGLGMGEEAHSAMAVQ